MKSKQGDFVSSNNVSTLLTTFVV